MNFFAKKAGKPRTGKQTCFLWGGLFCISILFYFAARLIPGFAEWYAVHIYPIWVGTLGRICSVFPFSVVEVLIYLGVLLLVLGIAAVICGRSRTEAEAGKKLHMKKRRVKCFLALLVKIVIVLFTLFVFNCGINYQRTTFSERAGFTIQKSAEEELIALCEFLVEEINAAAKDIRVDENGLCQLEGDVEELAREAMTAAAAEYPELGGYYPKAKPVASTWYLSYQLLQGVYSPFTVEANYNNGMPDVDKPSTICHELSHLKGFMREDEANFISWLACRVSESPEFRYSGNILAYIYAGNALYKQNVEAFKEVRAGLCEQGIRDLQGHNAYWDPYRGPVAEVSDKVNDVYLKANAQEDGVKSYGRMVDLLLAWMREQE